MSALACGAPGQPLACGAGAGKGKRARDDDDADYGESFSQQPSQVALPAAPPARARSANRCAARLQGAAPSPRRLMPGPAPGAGAARARPRASRRLAVHPGARV